jgi:hypothetical protein
MTIGANTLLDLISNKNKLDSIDDNVDLRSFVSTFRKWSKKTSTSPTGRHLGHYKSLFADNKSEYTEKNPDPKNDIMKVYHHIASSAVRWGVSLKWWQNSITSMIEKIPGCPKINKLRVIHLYEADYNLILKIL